MPVVAAAAAAVAGAASAAIGSATIAVASGLGALGLTATAAAVTASTLVGAAISIGEIAAVSVVGSLLQGHPKVGGDYGTQIDWKPDPQAGVPYIAGRTGVAGNIVLKDVAGDKNKYLFVTSALSTGPVQSVGGYQADSVLVSFSADGGEGASGGQLTTALTNAAAAGATSVTVNSVQGFAAGQTVTIGGESATIKTVYSVGSVLQLKGALGQAHGANAAVLGPSSTDFYKNRMWRKVSLGPPSAPHLAFTATGSKDTPADHGGIPASWGSSAKLSNLAHTIQDFEYDTAVYPTGEPKPLQVVEGVMCYDPRLDSTYPGGAGSHRWSDPRDTAHQDIFDNASDSWTYSANPYIHALNWCLGRWVRDRSNPQAAYKRTLGVGAPMQAIDVAAYVEGANIADAHGWTIGNQYYSTDPKWDVLVSMLQAGSGRPLKLGAMISCLVNAPKVSLDTLTGDEVVGEASIQATQAGRDRINAIWPRYREEAQGWQIVPTAAPVIVPAYVTADRGQRTKEVEYTAAAGGPDHVATLARYDIENSREFGPITLVCKPRWMGYRPGDCITITEPEYGLNGQKCLILNRSQDPATMVVTLTLRSETDAKHAYALGQTADPPPTPALTGVDPSVVSVPTAAEWAAFGGAATSASGQSLPQIVVTGACSDPNIAQVIVSYRLTGSSVVADWATLQAGATGTAITGLAPQTAYVARIQYRSVRGVVGAPLELPSVTTGGVATDWASVTDPLAQKPENNATVGAKTGLNFRSGQTGGILSDGAVVTGQGVALAVAGQGNLATRNFLTYGTPYLTGFGQLSPLDAVSFGSNFLLETSGGTQATLANFKTALGVAIAVAGQGNLATLNSLAFGGQYLTGFGAMAGRQQVSLSDGYIFRADGSSPLTEVLVITPLGVSAGFAGQQRIATSGSYGDLGGVPGVGVNRAVNSDFLRGLYGWAPGSVDSASAPQPAGAGYMATASLGVGRVVNAGSYIDVLSTAGCWLSTPFTPNKFLLAAPGNGRKLFAACLMGQTRCSAQLYALGFDGAGNLTESQAWSGATDYGSDQAVGNGDPAHYGKVGGVFTQGSGSTRWWALMWRMNGTGASSGSAPAWVYTARAQLGVLADGQTTVPDYAPGASDPFADQTGAYTAAAIAGQTGWATLVRAVAAIAYLDDLGRLINLLQGAPPSLATGQAGVLNPGFPLGSTPTSIVVSAATYKTIGGTISIPSATISGLANSTSYAVFYNYNTGGFVCVSSGGTAYYTANSGYIALGVSVTQTPDGTGGGGTRPPGGQVP